MSESAPTAQLDNNQLVLAGDWVIGQSLPEIPALANGLRIKLEGLGNWDSALASWIYAVQLKAARKHYIVEIDNAPDNLNKLLELVAGSLKKPSYVAKELTKHPFGSREKAAFWLRETVEAFESAVRFLGDIFLAFGPFIKKKAHFRLGDWLKEFHGAGGKAVPIVTLISFLVGLIVAFVSAIQLKLFGASLYVADLVGLSMTREMGALMSAIIMAGRTGAAYAAQIGSMKRSEELDALRTMGLDPMQMVVIPRVMALSTMLPLLAILGAFMGILAGLIITETFFDVSAFQYINQTALAVSPKDCIIGFVKAIVYGFLIAYAGAWRGMRCGKSADAVGRAATSAVVLGITLVIIANAIFAVLLNALQL